MCHQPTRKKGLRTLQRIQNPKEDLINRSPKGDPTTEDFKEDHKENHITEDPLERSFTGDAEDVPYH